MTTSGPITRLATTVLGAALVAATPAAHRAPGDAWPVTLPAAPAFARVSADPRAVPYGWPIRPFRRQHAIRGAFGDPRFGRIQRNFHFGVDIPAAGGTPVYAVAPGTVFLAPDRVDILSIGMARHASGFSYWHIHPAVREHALVAAHALLGWVIPRWAHVHFAELHDGAWVNPLRPHALTPYRDDDLPHIVSVALTRGGTPGPTPTLDVSVDAYVDPPIAPPAPWQDARLAPTLIRWRLLQGGAPVSAWRDAVDFRGSLPANALYGEVYADGTVPNGPGRPGRYNFRLASGWSLATVIPGDYRIEVEVVGSRGRTARATVALRVPGGPPGLALGAAAARARPVDVRVGR